MPRVRDFQPASLHVHASPKLQVDWKPNTGFAGRVWQFLIFLPRWFLTAQGRTMICTPEDEALLEDLLEEHFGGYTVGPSYQRGIGRRGHVAEANVHRVIAVLASRWRGTWRYFQALRRELEACSGEEQILILHQELWVV
jgi:hypothetical protein